MVRVAFVVGRRGRREAFIWCRFCIFSSGRRLGVVFVGGRFWVGSAFWRTGGDDGGLGVRTYILYVYIYMRMYVYTCV